jgi:predicted dehydrogenase
MNLNIYIIGTGQMAIDYTKVLLAQKQSFTVIGRGKESSDKYEKATGIKPIVGGIEDFLATNTLPENSYVISATGSQDLMKTMHVIMKAGAKKMLVEKPAAISIEELIENETNLKPYENDILIGYNRRFYDSVMEVERLIKEDGGLQSMHFEFTEWAHRIEPLQKAPGVKENWFFANSTHVVNLAFYLAGEPLDWHAYSKSGSIAWHDKTNFAGAGVTRKEVLFSYLSNWESAGRWAIELLTTQRRIYLKPIESIGIQKKGTLEIVEHEFDNSIDQLFKPGLYRQIEAFLAGENPRLLSLKEHIKMSNEIYAKMLK